LTRFQYGESTVYVHGFGTTNDNDDHLYNDYNSNEVLPPPPPPSYIVPYDKPAYAPYAPPPPPGVNFINIL
jgi:hypothetical protein